MEQIIHRGTPKPSQPLATDVLADIADCCTDGLENVARLRNLYVRSGQADEPAVLELEREFRELHSKAERLRGAAHAKMYAKGTPAAAMERTLHTAFSALVTGSPALLS